MQSSSCIQRGSRANHSSNKAHPHIAPHSGGLSPPHPAALAAPPGSTCSTPHSSLTTITHVPCPSQAPSLAQDEPTRAALLLCSLLCSLLPCSPPFSSPGMHAPHPPLLSQLPSHSTPLFS
jgi:hypothetical protein